MPIFKDRLTLQDRLDFLIENNVRDLLTLAHSPEIRYKSLTQDLSELNLIKRIDNSTYDPSKSQEPEGGPGLIEGVTYSQVLDQSVERILAQKMEDTLPFNDPRIN